MATKTGALIQDVTPLTADQPKPYTTTTGRMVATLYMRGVTIVDIFGMYYALEEQASAHDDKIHGNDEDGQHGNPLTVGDAELVGLTSLPESPTDRQPF